LQFTKEHFEGKEKLKRFQTDSVSKNKCDPVSQKKKKSHGLISWN